MTKRSINEKIEVDYNYTGLTTPPKGIMKAAQKLENFLKDKGLDKYCNPLICLDTCSEGLVQMLNVDCKGNYALAQAICALLIDNNFGTDMDDDVYDMDIAVYEDLVIISNWGDWNFSINDWNN